MQPRKEAASAKRTAEAASDEERRAKRAAAEQQRRDFHDMNDAEWDAFMAWLDGHELSHETVDDWHSDPAYETWRIERLADEWVHDEAACAAWCAAEQARMEQQDELRRCELQTSAELL